MSTDRERRTSEIRMIAQQVVDEQRQLCAAVSGADSQRWTMLEKTVKALTEDEKERHERIDAKLDSLALDVARIDHRWGHLPTIVIVSVVMGATALGISAVALIVAILSGG